MLKRVANTPRPTAVEVALARLTSGHGAQRLPSSLRTLEIQDVPFRGIRKGQREFIKTILPRLKYHNTNLEVKTDWHRLPDRKGKGKAKEVTQGKEDSTKGENTESKAALLQPVIHLHFDNLPSQQLPMKDVSVTDITRDMLTLIQSITNPTIDKKAKSAEEPEDEVSSETNEPDGDSEAITQPPVP